MSTQYNDMGFLYTERRKRPQYLLEKETVKQVLQPYIRGAKVMDMACGSGYYTYDLMEWGASSVTGVDISTAMLDANRSDPRYKQYSDAVNLVLADGSMEQVYPGAPFDIVVAAWFLNYAPDLETMTKMMENVSSNLRPGGLFVAVMIPPSDDPERELSTGPISLGEPKLLIEHLETVRDGVKTRVFLANSQGDGFFDCYHLRRDVYEAAARAGGLTGKLEWRITRDFDHQDLVDDGTEARKQKIEELAAHYFTCLSVFK